MTQFKHCAVAYHPYWEHVNGRCQGFIIAMYMTLSSHLPDDRTIYLDSATLKTIESVQAEHMADPVKMPSVLTDYNATTIGAMKLRFHLSNFKSDLVDTPHLSDFIAAVVQSRDLAILTLISCDYPGHTFMLDGRGGASAGIVWLYDSLLPPLVTPLSLEAVTTNLTQYVCDRAAQIIANTPNAACSDGAEFFFEAVTLTKS